MCKSLSKRKKKRNNENGKQRTHLYKYFINTLTVIFAFYLISMVVDLIWSVANSNSNPIISLYGVFGDSFGIFTALFALAAALGLCEQMKNEREQHKQNMEQQIQQHEKEMQIQRMTAEGVERPILWLEDVVRILTLNEWNHKLRHLYKPTGPIDVCFLDNWDAIVGEAKMFLKFTIDRRFSCCLKCYASFRNY